MNEDLSRHELTEALKTLIEVEETPHLHFSQHKLFTLVSVAIQYFLYRSGQVPGSYILRIEDGPLYEKLIQRAKDSSTRNFLKALFLPRKLKYKKSLFFLDYFNVGTWPRTNEIPREKLKGALIIKNSMKRPMVEDEYDSARPDIFPKHFFYTSLKSITPKTIILAYGEDFDDTHKIEFPWIQKKEEKFSSHYL
jgi:hypothetical protein